MNSERITKTSCSLITRQLPVLDIEFKEENVDLSIIVIGESTYPLSEITCEGLMQIIKDELWKALKGF